MRAVQIVTVFVLCFVHLVGRTIAAEPPETIKVLLGGRPIKIPVPSGFREVTRDDPDARAFVESTLVMPSNKLVAACLTDKDYAHLCAGEYPDLDRFLTVQVLKELERADVTSQNFKQVAGDVRKTQGEMDKEMRETVYAHLNKTMRNLSQEGGTPLAYTGGWQTSLGIFLDRPDAIAFAQLQKTCLTVAGEPTELLSTAATAAARVRGRLLYFTVQSSYDSRGDSDWVRKTMTRWLDSVHAANPAGARRPRPTIRRLSTMDWLRLIAEALPGPMIVIIIALFLIRARHKREAAARKARENATTEEADT